MVNAPVPNSTACASEICPAYPASTFIDMPTSAEHSAQPNVNALSLT